MADIIKLKRGSAQAWAKKNIVLASGEVGVELDTHQIKVGDGATAWNELPYVGGFIVNTQVQASNSFLVNDIPYETLEEAVAAAIESNQPLTLTKNYSKKVDCSNGSLTMNLNGNNILNNDDNAINISVDGKLQLFGQGTIETNKNAKSAIENCGEIIIDGSKVQRTTDVQGNGYYTIVNHGTMSITSGIFMSAGNYSSMIENGYWDYNSGDSATGYVEGQNAKDPRLKITGGTFAGGLYAIKNDDNAVLNINGGTFYNTLLLQGLYTEIKGGYFENNKEADGEYNLYIRKLNDDMNIQTTIISGGTFITKQDKNFKVEGEPIFQIKGGHFNRELDPSWIAEGHTQTLQNGFYVVL